MQVGFFSSFRFASLQIIIIQKQTNYEESRVDCTELRTSFSNDKTNLAICCRRFYFLFCLRFRRIYGNLHNLVPNNNKIAKTKRAQSPSGEYFLAHQISTRTHRMTTIIINVFENLLKKKIERDWNAQQQKKNREEVVRRYRSYGIGSISCCFFLVDSRLSSLCDHDVFSTVNIIIEFLLCMLSLFWKCHNLKMVPWAMSTQFYRISWLQFCVLFVCRVERNDNGNGNTLESDDKNGSVKNKMVTISECNAKMAKMAKNHIINTCALVILTEHLNLAHICTYREHKCFFYHRLFHTFG